MQDFNLNNLEQGFSFKLNKNQTRDLRRLIFEISQREAMSAQDIINWLLKNTVIDNYPAGQKFIALKKILIQRRFPQASKSKSINPKDLFLNDLVEPFSNDCKVSRDFKPQSIFVEKAVKNSGLVKKFSRHFPKIPIEEITHYRNYVAEHGFKPYDLKKPIVFLIKETWDFIKPCPCTKYHINCGYWILNLGFGCPYDCSYCFLQAYTNSPGIILPANLEDFFEQFDDFYKNLSKPIRLGTGEFCDSLSLDHITEYSKSLVPYFSNKDKVLFELKTKSANIDNLLKIPATKQVIISWSINPESIAQKEELAAATLNQRLEAALKIQEKGFPIGFHFDPIIHSKDYQSLYQQTIETIYSKLKTPFAWISLGTLRSHRKLKTLVEERFPQSDIFYGELLLGEDKKLRYPKAIRKEIYSFIADQIKKFDKKTPVYLCMEDKECWNLDGCNFRMPI